MLRIGLTGGIGSGKSTVARWFAEQGVPVIDADRVARQLVQPGTPGLADIVAHFGSGFLRENGEIDRNLLRKEVFSDSAKLRLLEELLHPRIRANMQEQLALLDAPYCLLVVPLLLETGQQDMVDRVLVVDAPPELQYQRIQQRDGLDEGEIAAIIGAQLDREERLSRADEVISNEGDMEALHRRLQTLHAQYLRTAGRDA